MLDQQYEPIRRLLARVRSRYRAIAVCHAIVRAALAASAVVGLALAAASVASLAARSPIALAVVAASAVVLSGGAVVWALLPLRQRPSDLKVARFVEERVPSLDDRLATAVDVVSSAKYETTRVLAEPLVTDAARRAETVDVDEVVAPSQLRRSRFQAAAASGVLLVLLFVARAPARQSLDAATLALFPARVTLDVTPGDARLKEGATLSIEAHLVGNSAPVATRLEIESGSAWRTSEMASDAAGRFSASVPAVAADFRYRVVAGTLTSPIYRVRVAAAPRVARIDVGYAYPASLGLAPHTEVDGGDVYAPSDTQVRLHIHTEHPVARGQLTLSAGGSVPLTVVSATELAASMTLSADGSYRVALVDREGLNNDAGTEYFIRIVDDRPPDIHVIKPASDRQVTSLEEVEIEAQADDDYGLERVELVYAVRGEAENVVPLEIPRRATSATVRHTIYLEELGVRPGDFVSYYVRARDVTRGPRSNEGRSDIFFLEVRPFEQEFSLAESQSMSGSGYNGSIDDLVNTQKQIVVATWKIDRRAQAIKGTQSPQDIRAIGQSESDLRTRVEEVASSLRESTMRDPRRRLGRGSDPTNDGGTARALPEEGAMTRAVDAMSRAVTALAALKTGVALPPEMQALNALLEAQALVKKRQVSRQQSAQGGPGNNNRNFDISTLFDKELQRLQATNYESRQSSQPDKPADKMADRIKELARRQDELLRREQELQKLPEAERRRELEKLTRDQAELRQQAEEMAKSSSSLKDVAQDMQGATSDLRRQDPASGQARGRQALDKLKKLAGKGDQQLEAKQLADDQRQVASDLQKTPSTDKDGLRKLAGEQERLAERARDVPDNDKQRVAERMRKSAEALRQASQNKQGVDPGHEANAQQEIARDLDKLADALGQKGASGNPDAARLQDALARARELREKLDSLTRELQQPGTSGDRNRLQQEAARQLQQTRDLIEQLRRQEPALSSGGAGFTFEGQGMTFSAPGTEAFKQDFARWQELRDQATRALDRVTASVSKRLEAQGQHDRLAAGLDDKAPASYREQVDAYFKAIAARKAR